MIAMVGAHDPLTFDDAMRLEVAATTHGIIVPKTYPRQNTGLDIINLDYGRDFLRERKRYATVIVHSVFHSNRTTFKPLSMAEQMVGQRYGVKQSPCHSIAAWCDRLVATRAQMIVVWELVPFALNGWQLGDLPDYRITHRDHRVTVYRRKKK